MIDLITDNELLECSLGFYCPKTAKFLVVKRINDVSDITDDNYIMVVNYGDIRDDEVYEILNEFSADDIANALSLHTKQINTAALDRKYNEEINESNGNND